MKSLGFVALGLTCCLSFRLNAQEQARVAPPALVAPIAPVPSEPFFGPEPSFGPGLQSVPLSTLQITPTPLGQTFNIAAINVRALDAMKAIAAKGNLQLIIADDAPNLTINVQLSAVTPQRAIESIASTNGLIWGKMGANTYLIVRAPSMMMRDIVRFVPAPSRTTPTPPDNWGQFGFNGQTLYLVPLQNDAAQTAPAKTPESAAK